MPFLTHSIFPQPITIRLGGASLKDESSDQMRFFVAFNILVGLLSCRSIAKNQATIESRPALAQ
jgi:hypothetical protein